MITAAAWRRLWPRTLIAAGLLILVAASPAGAQVCAGRQAFNAASVQAGGYVENARSRRGAGGHVGAGTNALFAIASFRTGAGLGARTQVLTGTVGTDQPLTADNRLRLCPFITAGHVWAPEEAETAAGVTGSAAMRLGYIAVNTHRRVIVPTFGVEFSRHRAPVDGRGTILRLDGGVGMLLPNRWGVLAEIGAAFSRGRGGPHLRLGASYGF